MNPQGPRLSTPVARDAASDYRRLLATLAGRARSLGSRDPEGAAQEALKRSLENAVAQPAVEYYFSQEPPAGSTPPQWPLDQLFAWLHGVLHYVVCEEHSRARYRREMPMQGPGADGGDQNRHLDPADPTPDPLDTLLRKELAGIVAACFPALASEHRTVLRMRVDGMKYGEIAARLGVNENTVSTWISRGIRELGQRVRKRSERLVPLSRGARR